MAKKNSIRVGDCVRLPAEDWAGVGKVTGKTYSGHSTERDLYVVSFFGMLRPMQLKRFEMKKAACPAHVAALSGARKKRK